MRIDIMLLRENLEELIERIENIEHVLGQLVNYIYLGEE